MLKRIKDVLQRTGVMASQDEIYLTSSLSEDLGVDSLQIIHVVVEMEKEFNVEIKDTQISNVLTVGDLVALITEK